MHAGVGVRGCVPAGVPACLHVCMSTSMAGSTAEPTNKSTSMTLPSILKTLPPPPPFPSQRQFPKLKYAIAQLDYMSDASVEGITYTPTFVVYRRGKRVDQFWGADEQQLRDHLWLYSDA
jgi:hypothetical protein